MSEVALKVENLSKQYRLGLVGTGTISHDLNRFLARWRGKEDPNLKVGEENQLSKGGGEYVWALQDINFEVKKGEVLGIIGKNGAGKSTLLKILSKVTAPTTGKIKANGRIASLLEVGTGMHPELTGRENIFLNGSILGMNKAEIRQKLDEIIDFAGIAKYVDTPVKRYSSGMSVRLGFAVAAFLEPEILIVDEVLAVGDAEFQKKAIGKMQDVSKGQGRTVLFVSHDMRAVKALCNQVMMIRNGQKFLYGNTDMVINEYLKGGVSKDTNITFPIIRKDIIIHDFTIKQNQEFVSEYSGDYSIELEMKFEVKENLNLFRIGFYIKDQYDQLISRKFLADWDSKYENIRQGIYKMKAQIPPRFLTSGNYQIEVHSSRYGIIDYMFGKETSNPIKVLAPSHFNLAHINESSLGYILWNDQPELLKIT